MENSKTFQDDKRINLTVKEADFWMQVYIAFTQRNCSVEGTTLYSADPIQVHYITAAEMADNAILELRKRRHNEPAQNNIPQNPVSFESSAERAACKQPKKP